MACWPGAENLIEMTHRAVKREEDSAIRARIGSRAEGTEPSGSSSMELSSHGNMRVKSCGVLCKILQPVQAIAFDI